MKTEELKELFAPMGNTMVATAPANEVSLTEKQIKVGDARVNLNANNIVTFGSALPIPLDYVKKLPKELITPLYRHALGELGEKPVTLILDESGKTIMGASNRAVEPFRPADLVDYVASAIEVEEWQIFNNHPDVFRFFAITERSVEVKVGDITKAGIEVVGSLFGSVPLQVSLVSERLVCTNGMVHTSHGFVHKRSFGGGGGGDGDDLGTWMTNAVAEAFNGVDQVFNELQEAQNTHIEVEVLENLDGTLRTLGYPGRNLVMRRIREEPPQSVYDLIQHMTWVSTHGLPERNAFWDDKRVFSFQRKGQLIAGAVLGEMSSCTECHQVVLRHETPNSKDGVVVEGEATVIE